MMMKLAFFSYYANMYTTFYFFRLFFDLIQVVIAFLIALIASIAFIALVVLITLGVFIVLVVLNSSRSRTTYILVCFYSILYHTVLCSGFLRKETAVLSIVLHFVYRSLDSEVSEPMVNER